MKTNYRLMLVAAAAIAFASCTKEQTIDSPETPGTAVKASFQASATDVKSTLDGLTLKWTDGDQIAFYQYGWYKKTTDYVARDYSRNTFSYNTTSGYFNGEITNYHPTEWNTLQTDKDTSKCYERFYAAYPMSNITSFGGSTCKFVVKVPSTQTGLKADFGKNAIYLGNISQTSYSKPVTSYEGGTLSFLKSFNMVCITPIIKFNVPDTLHVKQIVLTASKGDTTVNIAGAFKCRVDADVLDQLPSGESITIENGDNNICGDVYVALAPAVKTGTAGVYSSAFDKITLALTKDDGGTASLSVSGITTYPTGGSIKVFKSLPDSVNWTYGQSGGVTKITVNASGNAGRFKVETESSSATIKYAKSTVSFDEVGEPTSSYPSGGIVSDSVNYVRMKISEPHKTDKFENAIVWPCSKSKGFACKLKDETGFTAEVGNSYTAMGLTYTVTKAGLSNNYIYCGTDYADFMWKPGTTGGTQTNPQGYLTFVAPQNGSARLYIESLGSKRTVTMTNMTASETPKVSKSLGEVQAVMVTDNLQVSEGDVIKIEFSNSVRVNLIAFVWEPEVTD